MTVTLPALNSRGFLVILNGLSLELLEATETVADRRGPKPYYQSQPLIQSASDYNITISHDNCQRLPFRTAA